MNPRARTRSRFASAAQENAAAHARDRARARGQGDLDAQCEVVRTRERAPSARVQRDLERGGPLRHRRAHEQLFRDGNLLPLETTGDRSRNVVAFIRKNNAESSLVAIPRWLSQVSKISTSAPTAQNWEDTKIVLPEGSAVNWSNVITGGMLTTDKTGNNTYLTPEKLFRDFPVALLSAAD